MTMIFFFETSDYGNNNGGTDQDGWIENRRVRVNGNENTYALHATCQKHKIGRDSYNEHVRAYNRVLFDTAFTRIVP
jgi:hypothetical protein